MTQPVVFETVTAIFGLAFEPAMLEPRSARSHVLRGNRMRRQPETNGVEVMWVR